MGLVTLASHITLQSRLRRFWSETLSIVSRFWGPQVENGHARTHSAVAGLHRRDPTAQRGGGLLERAGEGIGSSWATLVPNDTESCCGTGDQNPDYRSKYLVRD